MTFTSPSDDILLSAHGIEKRFGTRHVLHNVSLVIPRGKIITIIGPNGSGKTTFAKILLGLIPADSGVMYRKPKLSIGYMPQKLPIDSMLPLSVWRFLHLQSADKLPHEQVTALANELKVHHLLDTQMAQLSGGELQRVLLAASLLVMPDMLLLDEPVQGVDIQGQAAFYTMIEQLRATRGISIVMISHDLHMVMKTTDHVICIQHHVCCEGSPEDVSRHPSYLALFGPEAARAMAVYTHHHDHVHDLHGDACEKGEV